MLKKYIIFPLILCCLASCNSKNNNESISVKPEEITQKEKSLLGAQATIYTTAKETEKKLSLDAKVKFVKATQPLETEIAVFVNPDKTFQEFLGIGGAITDAS